LETILTIVVERVVITETRQSQVTEYTIILHNLTQVLLFSLKIQFIVEFRRYTHKINIP